jgi:hypothetical protein
MRKSIVLVVALIIYGVLLGAAWAGKIAIGGTHSAGYTASSSARPGLGRSRSAARTPRERSRVRAAV